jgi:succinyl-CoA synthetase beta subunit
VIAGAIANFTDIKTTFTGIIDAFEIHKWEILSQNVQILVRRWGINEKAGLQYFKTSCETLGIKCKIADSSIYMTDILKEIKL